MPFTVHRRKVKPQFRRSNKTTNIAKKALVIARKNQIFNFVDFAIASSAMTASKVPTIRYLNPGGTGESCYFVNIEGHIWVRQNTASAVIDSYRVDIVLDRAPNGVVLDLLKCYEGTTPAVTQNQSFYQKDRYKIVRSWTGAFQDTSGTSSRMINFKIPTKLKVEGQLGTFSQANVVKNAYYIVYWTESSANTPLISYNIRTNNIS